MSSQFSRLDSRVQKWVYKQNWQALRPIQESAIEPILNANQDVIISASTASGKTEAFFLPACSAIADNKSSFSIIYISPLKALINDQFRRLEGLCEMMDMQLVPWHGDSSQARKKKAKKSPSGILLITPESLESLLIRDAGWAKLAFSALQYIVIDEFHAFIGTERGTQLLSQLNRLETLLDRQASPLPRVALSATLGDIESVPKSLRRNTTIPCKIINEGKDKSQILTKLFGHEAKPPSIQADSSGNSESFETYVCKALYGICKGGFHLVFANSRDRVEKLSVLLRDLCEYNNEFFPHHGSLSKELRESLETRLQQGLLPTTAICTMTLELGIDIGKVDSVAQVTSPHSISSLRQRLGRSGRREGSSPILRTYISEKELTSNSGVSDLLRIELLQATAMVRLLLTEKWFEPADTKLFHFSTLLHQVLALVAQWGGVRPEEIFGELCQRGPFSQISVEHFKILLKHMGTKKLLTQLQTGELVLGIEGERLVNHYTFYAVFNAPEEYRIIAGTRSLGTIPMDSPVVANQHIVFGGRRWVVKDIDLEKKVIHVSSSKGGKPPSFSGSGMSIHDRIREEMFELYNRGSHEIQTSNQSLSYLDDTAEELFDQGHQFFLKAGLSKNWVISQGNNVCLIPWKGDKIVNTLVFLLVSCGYKANHYAGIIEVEQTTPIAVTNSLSGILNGTLPSNTQLAALVAEKKLDKFDEFIPDELLNIGYGQKAFDVDATVKWLQTKFTDI